VKVYILSKLIYEKFERKYLVNSEVYILFFLIVLTILFLHICLALFIR